ncbi:MAG: hypothetical protein ACRBB2_04960 [Nitrosopumilus sp.]
MQDEDHYIKGLMLYRNNIKKNSAAARILETSYDVSEFSLFEMFQKIKKPYLYTKKIALELKYSQYLKSNGRGRYSITQKGRWFVICQRLDGLSFLSLCLLAEIYHKVKKNSDLFYPLSVFRNYYQKDYGDNNSLSTAIYKDKNISKSFQLLRQRNLVYVVCDDFIRMTAPMIAFLEKYDKDLESLCHWSNDTYEKCITYTIENNRFNPKVGKLFSKGSN